MIDLMFQSRWSVPKFPQVSFRTFRNVKHLRWEHEFFFKAYCKRESEAYTRSQLPYLKELLNSATEEDILDIFLDDRSNDYSWDDTNVTIGGKGFCLFDTEYSDFKIIPYYVYAYFWVDTICGEHRDVAIEYLRDNKKIPPEKLTKMFLIRNKIANKYGNKQAWEQNLIAMEEYLREC